MTESTTSNRPTVLITGANRGLGYETARRLGSLGWQVFLGSRDEQRGIEAAEKLTADGAAVTPIPLDVISDESVAAAVRQVEQHTETLDVLINNAGVMQPGAAPEDTLPKDFLPVFGANVLGPVRVTRAFLPLLRASARPRVVMVSSAMGSLSATTDPDRPESSVVGLIYPSSKAALNMITSQYARGITDVEFTLADPGYTATHPNLPGNPQTVTEGTDAIVALATGEAAVPSGSFIDRHGPVAW